MKIRRVPGLMLLAVAGLSCCVAVAENLDTTAQQQIVAATFEVVQLKPAEGAVTYERPLPMDLIPYQQRIDKYRSIGTAFAIGPNRYVTAGHVLALGQDSQFGPPALRDAAGKVYDIDQVLKYSDDQDFAEFSLKHAPSPEKVLVSAAPPPLNDTVFAVGNALGQGVVIRDGVYTSDTPEEVSGRWKWLRFSAAASPGNSGGPLVDKNGRVIGIVLRKSESENLNFAAPISLVTGASATQATIDSRSNFRAAVLDASEVIENHAHFALPATLADFYASMHKVIREMIAHNEAQVLDHNKARLFPNSATSATLLDEVARSPFPRMIREGQDRNWRIVGPQVKVAQLENNGFVRYGGSLFRLRAPDNVKLAALYGDSKLYMDLMLRGGFSLNRQIGTASIKVTSLGKAQDEYTKTDAWGRTWQVKIWAIPYADIYLLTMSLPTPEGYAAMFIPARGAVKDVVLDQQMVLADFMYVTYEGTLARWREYLPLRSYQPKVFGAFNMGVAADYGKVDFASRRFELHVTPDVLPLSATTVLALNLSYFADHGAVVWDVGGIMVGEGADKNEYVNVRRFVQPPATLPDTFQSNWKKLLAGEFPFNGVAADDKGGMKASITAGSVGLPGSAGTGLAAGVTGADDSGIRYALTVRDEGAPGQDAMRSQLAALQKDFKGLEH